jgi:acyl carrier protein
MAKNPQELRREVKKLISEVTRIPEKDLKEEARFVEDLGIDSMMALEIAAGMEKKYKVVIPEDKIPSIRSLENVYQLMEELLAK